MPDSQTSTNCSSASRAASGPWAIAIGVAAAAQSSGYVCLLEALLLPVRTYGAS